MPKRSWEVCFVLVLLAAGGCAGTTSSGSNGAGTPNGTGTSSGNQPSSGTPAAPTPVPAPPATGTPPQLALTDFVSGLTSPIGFEVASNDPSGRIFIVEQGGTIRIVQN